MPSWGRVLEKGVGVELRGWARSNVLGLVTQIDKNCMSRFFLALQGTASPFFCRLAAGLGQRGHQVRRVNFCGGDLAYQGSGNAWNYRDEPEGLVEWYRDVIATNGVSDVLLFGDCRAVHRPMHEIARVSGVRIHVFEEGYVRPHWITMERHGVNGRS